MLFKAEEFVEHNDTENTPSANPQGQPKGLGCDDSASGGKFKHSAPLGGRPFLKRRREEFLSEGKRLAESGRESRTSRKESLR